MLSASQFVRGVLTPLPKPKSHRSLSRPRPALPKLANEAVLLTSTQEAKRRDAWPYNKSQDLPKVIGFCILPLPTLAANNSAFQSAMSIKHEDKAEMPNTNAQIAQSKESAPAVGELIAYSDTDPVLAAKMQLVNDVRARDLIIAVRFLIEARQLIKSA